VSNIFAVAIIFYDIPGKRGGKEEKETAMVGKKNWGIVTKGKYTLSIGDLFASHHNQSFLWRRQ